MKRNVLAVLAAAQFLMVLDGAVMNVSISQLVEDLDTEVTRIQAAITFYSLVMAALMITGGKLGDRWGRKRAFTIGLAIYSVGSAITAIAPNVGILMLGWSLIEGIGAALVMPAMVSLVATNFTGRQRAAAYGVLGGVAGAGVAVGPILGGWVTTNLTWRLVFAGEVVVALAILAGVRVLADQRREGRPPAIDWVGAALSAVGLGLVVFGVLQSGTWGWFVPRNSPVEPFGLPLTPFVITVGGIVLGAFVRWQRHREAVGREPLVHLDRLRIPTLRAGLTMLLAQNAVLMGVFFSIPLYLQVVQGFNAFDTGLRMLPVSVTLFLFATLGPVLGRRHSPRSIVRVGLGIMLAAAFGLLAVMDAEIDTIRFLAVMGILGAGVGLVTSQLGNVVQSSVDEEGRSEAGGLQFTATQFGGSFGTALIGAVVIGGLASAFGGLVDAAPNLSDAARREVSIRIEAGVGFVPMDRARAVAEASGIPSAEAEVVLDAYADSQLQGLRIGLFVSALLALVALPFTRRLHDEPLGAGEAEPVASG